MTKPKLLIYGAGNQGTIIADIVLQQDDYELIGFIDDAYHELNEKEKLVMPILGGRDQLGELHQKGIQYLIIGIGDCDVRLELAKTVTALGFTLGTAIHPTASIAQGVQIGAGNVVKAMVAIEPGAIIRDNVILGAQIYVGHESIIDDGVHISAGGNIGGNSVIGKGAWVGIGATIINEIRIGARARIGPGSVVIEDVPDNAVAFGVPAKVRWKRDLWEED